jgi:hypothetical protein
MTTRQPSLPIPSQPADWLDEVFDYLRIAAEAAIEEGLDDEDDEDGEKGERDLFFLQIHARSSCYHARGLVEKINNPKQLMKELNTLGDLALSLRDAVPSDLQEMGNKTRLFLLFYLAAHVRAGILNSAQAQLIVHACWLDCDEGNGDESDDESDDLPLDIGVDAPDNVAAWVDEIIAAFAKSSGRPSLTLDDGDTFIADRKSMLQIVTVLALNQRQATTTREALNDLMEVISAMETDVSNMGPEWKATRRIPAMAFSMYYIGVHLSLGLADEDMAMSVMGECTARISDFRAPLALNR